MRGRAIAARLCLAVALACGVQVPLASADDVCHATGALIAPAPPATPRLVHDQLEGIPYSVLLPVAYGTSGDRYPVLYLLHSFREDEYEYLNLTDLVTFTQGEPAIVVTPFGGASGWYTDWRDGSFAWETFHVTQLIPHIDASFRTIADRDHRAIAGYSMGGFGALSYAARHPAMFSVAGSFSGVVDTMTARGRAAVGAVQGPCDLLPPESAWGDPITNEGTWRAHNPTDLAGNLQGMSLYLAARTGLPCPENPRPDPVLEPMMREMTENLSAALTSNGIDHKLFLEPCGGHYYEYVQRDIHRFWPQMMASFG